MLCKLRQSDDDFFLLAEAALQETDRKEGQNAASLGPVGNKAGGAWLSGMLLHSVPQLQQHCTPTATMSHFALPLTKISARSSLS